MAEANVVICNADGIEVVSLGGKNLHCRQKVAIASGSFTALNGPNGRQSWTYSLPLSGVTNPIVAIATDATGVAGAAYWYGGNLLVGANRSAAAPNAIAYVLDWGYPKGSTHCGVELYDPVTGAIVFTTADPPVRIVGPLRMPWGDQTLPMSYTPPAGRTYATLMCANMRSREVGTWNNVTGDIVANDFMSSAAGGLSGAVATARNGASGLTTYIGSLALPHGSPGGGAPGTSLGSIGGPAGCLVLDVTGI